MKRVGLAAVVVVSLFLVVAAIRAQAPFGGDDSGCVPDSKDHLKCSNSIAKGFGKLIKSVAKCHIKQASAAFKGSPADDETCENAAKTKFDATVAKVASLCPPAVLAGAGAEESILLGPKTTTGSLDQQNGAVYCAGTVDIDPSGDDAGKIPPDAATLKCESGVAKDLAGLAAAGIKCHTKMASSGAKMGSTDDETCEGAALTKYDGKVAKLTGCPMCLNSAGLAHSPTTGVVAQADGANFLIYPCPASTTTTTGGATTTTTGGATTTTTGGATT